MIVENPQTRDGTAIVATGSGRKKRVVQPLRSSPLFAPAVALWFAALFGLGTLATSTTVLELAVLAFRLDALIPAAAPPLGMTARILIAGGMTLLGGSIGFVVAFVAAAPLRRREAEIAAAVPATLGFAPEMPAFRARDLHPDAPVRAPVAAADELGEPLLDAPLAPAMAPLADLVDLGGIDTPVTDEDPMFERPRASSADTAFAPTTVERERVIDVDPVVVDVAPRAVPPLSAAAQRIADADILSLSNLELIERLAIAMQRSAAADPSVTDTVVSLPLRADRAVAPLTPVLRRLAEHRPEDTEKALRDALATLQRMSGAA